MSSDDDHLARDLAVVAGHHLIDLRARGGTPDELRQAGDKLSHEFLTAELARLRPDDVVLSEEGADDPARLGAERVWIIDPLDGTREFGEAGRTDWAVHVALWERAQGGPPRGGGGPPAQEGGAGRGRPPAAAGCPAGQAAADRGQPVPPGRVPAPD